MLSEDDKAALEEGLMSLEDMAASQDLPKFICMLADWGVYSECRVVTNGPVTFVLHHELIFTFREGKFVRMGVT